MSRYAGGVLSVAFTNEVFWRKLSDWNAIGRLSCVNKSFKSVGFPQIVGLYLSARLTRVLSFLFAIIYILCNFTKHLQSLNCW